MAFPTIQSVTETIIAANQTQHLVNMPAIVDAGDLLIVLFVNDGSATVTTPSGWSLLDSTASGSAARLSCYAKDAVGDEDSTTVDFVTSASEYGVAQCFRITGWAGTVPDDVENATAATGSDDSPDPASLTASWGSDDNLWIAACGYNSNGTVSAYPFSSNNNNTIGDNGPHGCGLGGCAENNATATNNPGTFTLSGSTDWIAMTLVIEPAAAPTTLEINVFDCTPVETTLI